MSAYVLCQAIRERRLVRIDYRDVVSGLSGPRIVEPHMVAYNKAEHISLSAWQLAGTSATIPVGWKEYLLSSISSITLLDETFQGTRPGYNSTGGKKFHNVQCAL